jgi:hypothetical protein
MIKAPGPGLVPVELSSATGTFLAGGFGVIMQIGAGVISRLRPANRVACAQEENS